MLRGLDMLVMLLVVNSPGGVHASEEGRLLKKLLADYPGSLARPVRNSSRPITVEFGLHLVQLIRLDEKDQILSTYVQKMHSWTDEFLKWDPSEYGGVTRLILPVSEIWSPDIVLLNNMDEHRRERDKHMDNVVVTSSGQAEWLTSAIYHSQCPVAMDNFPFDSQRCQLVFDAGSFISSEVHLVFMERCFLSGFATQNMVQTIEWQVTNASHKRTAYDLRNASCRMQDGDEYVYLEFNIHMARNPSYFAKFTLLPILLLTVLVLVIFCIPPTRPDRTSLGTSLFGSFMLLLLLVVELSPPSAGSLKLGTYCCLNMIMIVVATILSVMVVNIAKRSRPMSLRLKTFVYRMAHMFCIRHKVPPPSLSGRDAGADRDSAAAKCMLESQLLPPGGAPNGRDPGAPPTPGGQHNHNKDWQTLALILDRVFFTVYSVLIGVAIYLYFPFPH